MRPAGRTPQESKTAIALFPFLEDNSVNFVPNLAPTGMLNGLPFWYADCVLSVLVLVILTLLICGAALSLSFLAWSDLSGVIVIGDCG